MNAEYIILTICLLIVLLSLFIIIFWKIRRKKVKISYNIFCYKCHKPMRYLDTKDMMADPGLISLHHFYECEKCKRKIYIRLQTSDDKIVSTNKEGVAYRWELPATMDNSEMMRGV